LVQVRHGPCLPIGTAPTITFIASVVVVVVLAAAVVAVAAVDMPSHTTSA
jgi:hypothetical protein